MQKEQRAQLLRLMLYAVSGVIVGAAVGGTLLLKMTTQDNPPTAESSVTAGESAADNPEAETTAPPAAAVLSEAATEPAPPDADTVRSILLPAESLLTMTYYYTDSDCYENHTEVFGKKMPFTTESVVLTYDGTICMGLDPNAITYTVNADAKQITVTLPQPKVLSHDLDEDSIEFYDVKNSIFVSSSIADYTALIAQIKDQICEKVICTRQFDRLVTENAETVLRNFLAVSEQTASYTVIFEVPETHFVYTEDSSDAEDPAELPDSDVTDSQPTPEEPRGGWIWW